MRIHEVIIGVGDVEEAVAFYTKVLGLTHVRSVEHERQKVAELDADGQRVTLVPADEPGITLAFHTESVATRKRKLGRNKVKVEGDAPVVVEGGAWLPFADPWGNPLGYWEDRSEEP